MFVPSLSWSNVRFYIQILQSWAFHTGCGDRTCTALNNASKQCLDSTTSIGQPCSLPPPSMLAYVVEFRGLNR